MDLDELRQKTPEDLLKLIREIKSKSSIPDSDKEFLRIIKLVYQEKFAQFEVRVGESYICNSFMN